MSFLIADFVDGRNIARGQMNEFAHVSTTTKLPGVWGIAVCWIRILDDHIGFLLHFLKKYSPYLEYTIKIFDIDVLLEAFPNCWH